MEKYMEKAKNEARLAVMDVSQSSLGVLTRAKTLALKRLQQSLSSPPGSPTSGSYLQLRNRRLKKPLVKQTLKHSCVLNPSSKVVSRLRTGLTVSGSNSTISDNLAHFPNYRKHEETTIGVCDDCENKDDNDLGVEEASFGENVLDFEYSERSMRELTPCNLIRDPYVIRTPSSTTRPTFTTEAISREHQHVSANLRMPTAQEIDDFFTQAEEIQRRQFIDKYNFDPVNDIPLAGRYQWETLEV